MPRRVIRSVGRRWAVANSTTALPKPFWSESNCFDSSFGFNGNDGGAAGEQVDVASEISGTITNKDHPLARDVDAVPVVRENVEFIGKPFTFDALAAKMRFVLGG